jgi:threonine/homoserine/homoserine lactone efflux protein
VPVDIDRLVEFIAGYLVILATPGPNIIAVGGMAALRGLGGAMPLCLGTAMGAGALGTALLAAVSAAPGEAWWDTAGHIVGALLLLWLAASIARQQPPTVREDRPRTRRDGLAAFGAGFCTAATNPLTAAFFGSQFLVLRDDAATITVAPMAIFFAALGFFVCFAILMARPTFRNAALAWHRPIRLTAAAVLVLMAFSAIKSIL